jgi:hypothetical protein
VSFKQDTTKQLLAICRFRSSCIVITCDVLQLQLQSGMGLEEAELM